MLALAVDNADCSWQLTLFLVFPSLLVFNQFSFRPLKGRITCNFSLFNHINSFSLLPFYLTLLSEIKTTSNLNLIRCFKLTNTQTDTHICWSASRGEVPFCLHQYKVDWEKVKKLNTHTHTNRHNAQHRQSGTKEKRRKPRKVKKGRIKLTTFVFILNLQLTKETQSGGDDYSNSSGKGQKKTTAIAVCT